MQPTLADLEDLARRAGAILRRNFHPRPGFGPQLQVNYKSETDPVTEIDHLTEAFLLEEIQGHFPEHQIITEESGLLQGNLDQQWFLDPLDGTINFAHGVPIFVVSIAYAHKGKVIQGTVYDPILDECFSAERGRGAWLNGEPIRVSVAQDLGRSLVGTGFPYDVRNNPINNLENHSAATMLTQAVRHMGAAARDLCYVAVGRLDAFWELRLNPWDIAGGGLIAEEAGAIVTKVSGDPQYMLPPHSILAANPNLHPQVLKFLNQKPAP
jgi:myo-inositol-1(or 4)-monophosphatase